MSENTMDRLEIQIQAQAQKALVDIDKLIGKFEKMSSSLEKVNDRGVNKLSSGIDRLAISMKSISEVKTTEFTRLAKNIDKIGSVNQAGVNNTASALRQISSALTATGNLSGGLTQLTDLTKGISKLGSKSVSSAITNLPLLAQGMKQFMATLSTAPQVSANLIQMTNAMANLASQGSKYNTTIKSMSSAARNLSKAHSEAHKSNSDFFASLSKIAVGYYVLKRAVSATFEPIKKSMDLGETINLFQSSFKKIGMEAAEESGLEWGSAAADAFAVNFIDKAQSFNDRISEALSLDPNVTMNYQAVFAQMSNAFGLTNDSVMNLSESFTMLGLDIASFFNTGVEEAMVKLRAGLAGESEPLRAIGVDITEATLKMTAMKYGIDGTISKMSQASKTQLRWLAIMDQTETVLGDMAKTIDQPAAQVRILQQQIENLSRTFGSIFLPIISTVLPYVNAFAIALQRMLATIAGAMGYELPDYTGSDTYKDITGGITEVGDSAADTDSKVKKLQKSLAGFDVLNNQTTGKDKANSGSSGAGSGFSVLDDAIAKKTESYMSKFNDELQTMSNKANDIAKKNESFFKTIIEKSDPAIKAMKDLGEKFEPFTKNVGEGWNWLYDNLISKLANITISETVPNALYAVSSAVGAINTAVDKFKTIKASDTIFGFLADMQETKLKDISDWFKAIGDAFTALTNFINEPNWKDALEYIKKIASISFDISGLPDFTDPFALVGIPEELVVAIKATIATKWEDLREKWGALTGKFIGKTVKFAVQIPQVWSELKDRYESLAGKFIGKTVKFLVSVPQTPDEIYKACSLLAGKFVGKTVKFLVNITQAWKDISSKFDSLYNNFIGKTVEFTVKLVTTLGDIRNFVNSIISAVNESVIAKLKIDIPLLGLHVSAPPIPMIQTRANGGYVNYGQMFIARENGINEMVGRIGNRSAVANNDQITEGIATAVENAMLNVLVPALVGIGGSGTGDTVVNIDGREVFRAVRNQADQYYNRTKESPFRG